MSNTGDEMSPGGSRMLSHGQASDFEPARGHSHFEAISAHIERHLGPIASVLHEIISDAVHLDIHVVPPCGDCPNTRLVTSGTSDLPMQLPDDVEVSPYLELMLTLPGDWPLEHAQLQDERNYWPIRLLKTLARLPHKHNTWLGLAHTVPNGDPAQAYAPGVDFGMVVDLQRARAGKARVALQAVLGGNGFHGLEHEADEAVAFALDARHHGRAIDPHLAGMHAERTGRVQRMRRLCRGNQELAWHAADPGAGGAVMRTLDDYGARALRPGGTIGRHAGGARADDGNIHVQLFHGALSLLTGKTIRYFTPLGAARTHSGCH